MLSNHLRHGIETARVAWSQLPASEDLDGEEEGPSVRISGTGVESLDYEVIENFAYREEQVSEILGPNFNAIFISSYCWYLFSGFFSPFDVYVSTRSRIGTERETLRGILRDA